MKKIFLLLTLFVCSLFADKKVKIDIPFEKYQLKNGLEVILAKDDSTPFIAVDVWYQVGSLREDQKKTGLAHLFEHLMFEGSRHFESSKHFELLSHIGANNINASTGFDRTNYYEVVRGQDALLLALQLESSRMSFLNITKDKLDEQREVVKRERDQRGENQAYGKASEELWQKVFPHPNPYHGLVIGSHKDLNDASLKDVQDFYDRFYGPSNASLAIVGNFNIDDTKKIIDKYFATLPSCPKLPAMIIDNKPISSEVLKFNERLGKLTLIRMHYITPALYHKGDAEMDVLGHLLAGGQFSRLQKALIREKPIAAAVSAYQQSMEHLSVFTIDVILNKDVDENEALKAIDDVLANLSNITKTEIDRARNSILKDLLFSLQSPKEVAEILQSYNRFAANPGYINKDLKRYKKVDEKSLKESITKYVNANQRKVLIAKPINTGNN